MASGDDRRPAITSVPVPLPRLLAIPRVPVRVPATSRVGAEQAWAGAATGGRSSCAAGAAGTGKTRLASDSAGGSAQGGACSTALLRRLAAPYQPFAEAVEHLVRAHDADQVRELVGGGAAELSRLAPALNDVLGVTHPPAGDDPDAVRFRLFGAMSSLLGAVSARRPVLLVLDDLHWAGRPTVQMLDHLSRDSSLTGVVIVALYRSLPAEVGDALREALPDLRRLPGVVRATVPGFDHAGIRRFVDGAAGALATGAGGSGDQALATVTDLLAGQTGGNPFLMGELWRHLVDAGYLVEGRSAWRIARPLDDVASPEGVREVVAMRLEALPDETRCARVAAVVGRSSRRVSSPVRRASTSAGCSPVSPRRAGGAGRGGRPGEHRFAHASCAGRWSTTWPAARRALHLEVGRVARTPDRRGPARSPPT